MIYIEQNTPNIETDGLNTKQAVDFSGAPTVALPAGTTGQISNITDAGSALQSGTITPDQYSNLASQYSSAYAPAAADIVVCFRQVSWYFVHTFYMGA